MHWFYDVMDVHLILLDMTKYTACSNVVVYVHLILLDGQNYQQEVPRRTSSATDRGSLKVLAPVDISSEPSPKPNFSWTVIRDAQIPLSRHWPMTGRHRSCAGPAIHRFSVGPVSKRPMSPSLPTVFPGASPYCSRSYFSRASFVFHATWKQMCKSALRLVCNHWVFIHTSLGNGQC